MINREGSHERKIVGKMKRVEEGKIGDDRGRRRRQEKER